jgi:hypothetical protein
MCVYDGLPHIFTTHRGPKDDYRTVQLAPGAYTGTDYHPRLKWTPRGDLPSAERPSDALLRTHFQQALLRFVLGLPYSDDLINAFNQPDMSAFAVDLGDARWVAGEGKALLEHYLMQKLFSWLPAITEGPGREQLDSTRRTGVPAEGGALKRKRSDSASASDGSPSPLNDKELWFDVFVDPPPPARPPVQYREGDLLPPFPEEEDEELDPGTGSSSGHSNGSGLSSPDFFD